MKNSILVLAVVIVVIGAIFVFGKNKKVAVAPTTTSDYKDISYKIDGQDVKLTNGVSEVEAAPGSASKIVTKYFGDEVKKDLNGDGLEDVAFIMTQETGGSGTFFYVAAALKTNTGYAGSQAMLLGDRITPQTVESGPGNSIIVNYQDRKTGEPMTTQPSVGKSIRLILDPSTMQFGEVAQDFEGEANPQTMKLNMKTWKWVETDYNTINKAIIKPGRDIFTLTFNNDDTFSATTDCNNISGKYTADASKLTLNDTITTLMFCDGSQETDFLKMLRNTDMYKFTSKGELILSLKDNGGSAYFK